MEIDYSKLASAYLQVLDESQIVIPEEIPANERNAFMGAAAAAHKAGKSHFNFGGQKHKVTMKKDTAKSINSEKITEGVEKVECQKCEGKGCAHCDMKGYHMTGTADNNVKGTDEKKTTEKVQEGNMDGMCCKNCGDMFGQPTEGNCTYDAYDPKGKNWIKAEKQHESVDEDVNFVPHSNCPCGDDCNCDPCTCAEVELVNEASYMKGHIMDRADAHHDQARYHRDEAAAAKKGGDNVDAMRHREAFQAHTKAANYLEKHHEKRERGQSTIINNVHSQNAHAATQRAPAYTNESVDLDEISRSMTPMRNRFGGNVDPKKFDTYKKHMKTHNLDEPTVRMIHQNPDDAESKRMMKNPKYAQALALYKDSMKKESVDEKKLTPKEIKRALASIKPPKKKPTLPKAPFEIPKENTLPAPEGGKKRVRSADKRPVNVNVDGKTVTRMEPVTKRTAAAYESVNRENWLDALQNKKLQEAEDAKTKMSKPTAIHHSDDATRDTFDKQLSTRKGEKDFVDAHKIETPEYADVLSVVPKTFAAFTAGVNSPKMRDNDNPQGDKKPVKNDGK